MSAFMAVAFLSCRIVGLGLKKATWHLWKEAASQAGPCSQTSSSLGAPHPGSGVGGSRLRVTRRGLCPPPASPPHGSFLFAPPREAEFMGFHVAFPTEQNTLPHFWQESCPGTLISCWHCASHLGVLYGCSSRRSPPLFTRVSAGFSSSPNFTIGHCPCGATPASIQREWWGGGGFQHL